MQASSNAIRSGAIHSDVSCRLFSLDEILTATNNFDDALVIGTRGFGKVYRGHISYLELETRKLCTMAAAIKRLNAESKQGAGEFWTEVKMLSNLQHTHLVSFIGYCDEFPEMILVYEYMALGTLANHLYKLSATTNGQSFSPLSWEQRLTICIGAARGLHYLHAGTDQSLIHRDVKTTNILLDRNLAAKICDFGLSKGTTSHSITHVTTDVRGTWGYLDPEYFLTRRLTKKSDVYAFGVVLLEVLCGRPAVDTKLEEERIGLVQWAQHCIKKGKLDGVIDPYLCGQIAPRSLKTFVELANRCLHKHRKSRPTIDVVLVNLVFTLLSQQKGRTEGMITKAFHSMDRWLRERKDNGYSRRQSKDVTPGSDESSVPQLCSHSSLHGEGLRMLVGPAGSSERAEESLSPDPPQFVSGSEEGPGIEEFQIIGKAKPGYQLLGCGFPVRGTSHCMFRWVRHHQDGTRQYIEGATYPEYLVTADDVDKLIALECIPKDDRGYQGNLVRHFANGQNKITCDPDMQLEIDAYISKGEATFSILLLMDSSETWEPTTLILKQSGYQIKDSKSLSLDNLIAEKFRKDLSIKIPSGRSNQFVLTCSNGYSYLLSTDNDVRMRDTLVLTMRMFQRYFWTCRMRDTLVLTMRMFQRRWMKRRKGRAETRLFLV